MRFLLDACASSQRLRNTLNALGHDVVSALDHDPRASDETLLAWATAEERILITEDKDFGDLVFIRGLPHPCIVRLVAMTVTEKVTAIKELLEQHEPELHRKPIVVVTKSRIRIRHHEIPQGGDA